MLYGRKRDASCVCSSGYPGYRHGYNTVEGLSKSRAKKNAGKYETSARQAVYATMRFTIIGIWATCKQHMQADVKIGQGLLYLQTTLLIDRDSLEVARLWYR
jgi:hypothetical protein